MTLWQLIRLTRLLNCKSSRPITSLQILEAINRDTRSTCCKLQETRFLLGVPAANALPEVLDDFVVFSVATVIRVFLPVVHVDVGDTADEELEFALVEHVDEIGRDELVEAGNESLELLFDALLDPPLSDEPAKVSLSLVYVVRSDLLDVFALVLIRDLHLLATRLQLNADSFSKSLIIGSKCQFKGIRNVVVPAYC
jgi:hypothetical protein